MKITDCGNADVPLDETGGAMRQSLRRATAMLAVALLAALVPVIRAVRIDPVAMLRAD